MKVLERPDAVSVPAFTAAETRPKDGHLRSHGVFLTALALVCGLTAYVGLAPMRLFEHDIFFFLDNGYRVLQGQVPHRDFSSAWGPITYLIEAAGLVLSGMRPAGIGYANALFAALIGTWAYRIGRSRLPSPIACALGIYTALLIAGPFSLGYGAFNFSHAMTYNRYGFALLGIILVESSAFPGWRTSPRQLTLGALSTGAAWAVLTFLKITYGMMAFPFVALSLVAGRARRGRLVALCGAFGIVAALVMCYLRFDFADLLSDLAMAASGRSRSWKPGEIVHLGFGQFAESLPILFLAVAVSSSRKAGWLGWGWRLRMCLLAALTLAVGGILLATNHQPSTLPLNGYAAAVLASVLFSRRRSGMAAAANLDPLRWIAVFLAAVCLVPLSAANAGSLIAAALQKRQLAEAQPVHLAASRGAAMVFAPVPSLLTTETGGPAYILAVNDGIALLRRHTGPRDGVLTIDMLNPFNYLLDRPSPHGGLAAAAFNYVISQAAHPSADRFFGDAHYILVRKYSNAVGDFGIEDYHIQGLEGLYQRTLRERYSLIEESGHWLLYGPKGSGDQVRRDLP